LLISLYYDIIDVKKTGDLMSTTKLTKSFKFLNITQFFGALNDHIFKMFIIFALINIKGIEHSNSITALAGAVFVIPFLLFSIQSGILADRHSKRNIVIATKALELCIMIIGMIAFIFQHETMLYFTLFLMATQSTIFGPSKYGIIAEMVPEESLLKANSIIAMFTYIAVIAGTFFASLITDLMAKNFARASIFCILIAQTGLLTSFGVKKTGAEKTKKKGHIFFFVDVVRTLKESLQVENLSLCIYGSAFFLFVGAFAQMMIIPYAIFSLKMREVDGGYLFLVTALGIGLGSYLAGKAFGKYSNLKIVPIAGMGMAICCFLLRMVSHSLPAVLIVLVLLGICGGLYLVPQDTYIQIASPSQHRSRYIATGNLLGFVGVLMASGLVVICSSVLKLPPHKSFGIVGSLTMTSTAIQALLFHRKR
jgi:acyl-[acyl-carrier-protein]-phospholipid O-acyltransferase / long-chain-fatty-acid--[acyl-carrier-protein] ligase